MSMGRDYQTELTNTQHLVSFYNNKTFLQNLEFLWIIVLLLKTGRGRNTDHGINLGLETQITSLHICNKDYLNTFFTNFTNVSLFPDK